MRKWQGSGVARGQYTLWEDCGTLVLPRNRVAALRDALEAALHEQLARTQVAKLNDGRQFERPSTYVHATVVSLSPDIAIAAVAEMPIDSTQDPFDGTWWSTWSHDDPKKPHGFYSEYIDCYQGNRAIYVGSMLPYRDEMYLVSANKDLPVQRVPSFERQTSIQFGNASLTLRREGEDVHVSVEYR